jgi:hypothetical protein
MKPLDIVDVRIPCLLSNLEPTLTPFVVRERQSKPEMVFHFPASSLTMTNPQEGTCSGVTRLQRFPTLVSLAIVDVAFEGVHLTSL